MSVNVTFSRSMNGQGDQRKDAPGSEFMYEVLPGGALAVIEKTSTQTRTLITYSATAWIQAEGRRKGEER